MGKKNSKKRGRKTKSVKKKVKKSSKHNKKNKKSKSQKSKNIKKSNKETISLLKKKEKNKDFAKISTGISMLDKITQGGFGESSVNLLVGGSGTGKSVFSVQFLVEGLKKGDNCLYISFDETKDEFYRNMKELGWNLEDYEKKGKLVFLEYTPEKVRKMLEEGGGAIETTVLNKDINRMVMDSITAFPMLFNGLPEKRQAILDLFNMLRKWDCPTIITYERDPLIDQRSSSRILELESDSIIMLYFFRKKKEREHYLEIIKMRGTDHSTDIWPYDIKKGGIKIGKKPYKGELPDEQT